MFEAIGIQIKRVRRRANLSQAKLAEKTGTTGTSIYNYEKGRTFPDMNMLQKIAKETDSELIVILR